MYGHSESAGDAVNRAPSLSPVRPLGPNSLPSSHQDADPTHRRSDNSAKTQKSPIRVPARTGDVEMLDREIGKLDKLITDIMLGATSVGGKKVLNSAQRAKLNSLKRQRQNYKVQLCRFAMQMLEVDIWNCITMFSHNWMSSVNGLPDSARLRLQLHTEQDFAKNWEKLSMLPSYGDTLIKSAIEETKTSLRAYELRTLAELEKQRVFVEKQRGLEDLPEEEEDQEIEMEMDIEQMQQNIERLQSFLPTGMTDPHTVPDASTAFKAALYLKKKMKKMAGDVDVKALTEITSVAEGKDGTDANRLDDEEAKMQIRRGWLEFEADDAKGRDEFVGELRGISEHGLGSMTWIDGASYRGDFKDGTAEGFGHEVYADASTYKGEFKQGERCGLGVFVSSIGEQYSGEWSKGERHGHGIIKQVSEGLSKSVLGTFRDGELVQILRDEGFQKRLSESIHHSVREALKKAQQAQSLASEIIGQAKEGEDHLLGKQQPGVLLGPAHHLAANSYGNGPGACSGLDEAEAATRERKPHDDLCTWLESVGLESAIAEAMRSQGVSTPERLLHFLTDVDAFDVFVDAVGFKPSQARLLWKSMGESRDGCDCVMLLERGVATDLPCIILLSRNSRRCDNAKIADEHRDRDTEHRGG